MAGRLKLRAPAAPGARRRAAFVLLVLAVVAVHGCIGEQIAIRMTELASAGPIPTRIEVAYVRELAPSAPSVMVASPPAPLRPPSHSLVTPARPASAPQVAAERSPELAAVSQAASAPERIAGAGTGATVEPEALASAGGAMPGATPADAADFAAAFEPAEGESWFAATPDPALAPEAAATRGALATVSAAPASAPGIPAQPEAATLAADAATAPPSALAAAPLPPSMPASGAAPELFEWPVSTRISYALAGNYRGEVLGSAQVEWIRVGSRYQVHLDLVIGASFAPLITRRMSSDGEITADGLAPRRYDQDTRVMFNPHRRVTLRFEPDTVVLANGQRRASVPGVQDSASQFVQLTYLFSTRPELLRVGNTVRIPLALPHKLDVWTYDVTEAVTLHTSFGPLDTLHLVPLRRPGRKAVELSAEIWFAPQLRYLPVRFRIEQDPQTFIELMIARRPEMAGS